MAAASSWQTDYDLTLELYAETTQVAYLCGNFEQVEYWAAIVLQQSKTVLDTVKVYEFKIQTGLTQLAQRDRNFIVFTYYVKVAYPEGIAEINNSN